VNYKPIRRTAALLERAPAGLIFTIVLTVVSTVAGIAVGTAGASARTFGPVARPHRCGLCRIDPQHALHRAVVLHLLLACRRWD
jgi:ABC-type amino acid transport system permease subunit